MTVERKNNLINFVPVGATIILQTVALIWMMASFKATVTTEIQQINKSLDSKASKESVDAIGTRLSTVERKTDRIDRQLSAHTGLAFAPNN